MRQILQVVIFRYADIAELITDEPETLRLITRRGFTIKMITEQAQQIKACINSYIHGITKVNALSSKIKIFFFFWHSLYNTYDFVISISQLTSVFTVTYQIFHIVINGATRSIDAYFFDHQ